eukprot:c16299_g1_i2 orf=277-3477(+)
MALQQRLEKKGMGAQDKAIHSRKHHGGSAGIPAHTIPTGKHPYACNTVIPTNAMPTSKYPHAVNMNVPAHAIPINKSPYACNVSAPIHTSLKGKQQTPPHTAPITTSRISQPPPLDMAMPSTHGLWKLRPLVALDFDVHTQKLVPKKNQIAVLRRHLSPHLQWKKHEHSAVADVIEVPPELFQLKDLTGILSLEAWKGCLSPSERRFLRGLIPEGADHRSLVRAITGGENFYFGNPLTDWGKILLKGEFHPDFVEEKELKLKQAHKDHNQEVQKYHDKMLQTLRRLKEEWILCKSTEKRLNPKIKRQKSKRQKIGSVQQASGRVNLLLAKDSQSIKSKVDNCIHYDGCAQSMHILKVTRKQYADILHLLKGKGDELSVAALSPMLNYQQKIEVNCANGCDGKDAQKVRKFWSKLVEKDIPAAHATFFERKADKERVAKSAAEQCMQYYSVFMCKEIKLDLQSNSNAVSPSEPEELALEFQGSIEAENEDLRNSSASESSVTCLEEQAGTQAPVESCLSSADDTRNFLSQHLIQEEQVSLIDLPSGSSLANEGHATLLASAEREKNFAIDCAFDVDGRLNTIVDTMQQAEDDTLSRCNEGSVVKHIWSKDNLEKQEMQSSGKELANSDVHSKPGSEVVSATAASGESEEVEQRVDLQSGDGLDHQLFSFSGPSTLLGQSEPAEKGPLFCSNDASNKRNFEDTEDQVVHQEENCHKGNLGGRFHTSVPSTEDFSQSKNLHSKEYSHVFEMEQTQVDNEQNNQMMLHLFLDQKSHSSEFLSTDASSSQALQGKSSFCESDEAPSVTPQRVGDHMLKEQEPITELSLLVDDRSAKQKYQIEQAESVSSRTRAEFCQHDSMEPNWMMRHNKQDAQIYPFRQNSREVHHLSQLSQDAYSSVSFSPMLPLYSNPQQTTGGNASHLFKSHWNVEENAVQTNWISAESPTGPFFSSARDEGGRPSSVAHYWDQPSRGPGMNNWSSKHEQSVSLVRGATSSLQDEQFFQGHENWGPVQSQSSSHLPYLWAMDRSGGRMASHPWRNASMLSSPQYEQQKLQNACLSKMNPNFTASWH